MAYTRERICTQCKKTDIVRKDNKSEICKSCSAKKSGKKGLESIRLKTKFKKCKRCDNKIEAYKKWEYCSRECSHKDKSIERACKHCNSTFYILKSTLKTNSSGNYCSRKCYNNYMCDTKRVKGRGSRWKSIRKEVIKATPFCVMCGTQNNLQVHHIIPYRYTKDNSKNNLVPLCTKHHKKIEIITNELLKINDDLKLSRYILNSLFNEYRNATLSKIKEIKCKG